MKVMKKVLKEMLSNPKELFESIMTLVMIGVTVYSFYFIGYIFFLIMDKKDILDRLENVYRRLEEAKYSYSMYEVKALVKEASELTQLLMSNIRQ